MRYNYSAEAKDFIKLLKNLDLEKFEKWIDTLVLQIGSNNVLQFLEEKKRWNTIPKVSDKVLRCDFSRQSKTVIQQCENFNEEECKIWFSNSLMITKNDILNFLEQLRT